MRVHLLHPDRDADMKAELPPDHAGLVGDLGLDILLGTMAGDDNFILDVARRTLLCAPANDRQTVIWRQQVLRDCLAHEVPVRKLYALSVEAEQRRRSSYFSLGSPHPEAALSESVRLLETLLDVLRELRLTAVAAAADFAAPALRQLCAVLDRELSDDYLARVALELRRLHLRAGVLVSAGLGPEGKASARTLREPTPRDRSPLRRLLTPGPKSFALFIHPRDDGGWRALGEMRSRGVALVADAVQRSAAHVVGFFRQLRYELGFYLGCLNLAHAVGDRAPTVFPEIADRLGFRCADLRDAGLVLNLGDAVVGNDVEAAGRPLVFVTGANRGGKSTFLRSLGLAQLMLQAGLFVTARQFSASLCDGVFTHFARQEDASMTSGKFDDELGRMSDIVDRLGVRPLLLFNESFAGTNEREGSEVARQIIEPLVASGARVVFVTHMLELARAFDRTNGAGPLHLRAERGEDGFSRSFRLIEGEPAATSHAEDLFAAILGDVLPDA